MENKPTHELLVEKLCKSGEAIVAEMTPETAHLWHMATGIAGEAGELLDAIKKHAIYGKELDLENVIEELGDLAFYIEGLQQGIGVGRTQVLNHNILKLSKRYKSLAYSNDEANARADKDEK